MTTQASHLSHPKYRPDIDGLRAVAVLSVIAFHAFPSWMKGGFIGVDVFFVISGFLISTIIFENLDRGTFSFSDFYARRIKRIFPALLLVLIASFTFGWFALLANEYKQLGKHIAAGAGFFSNLVLWSEAGYFDNSAETKPLLHLWSLGIEEQFYIVWPFILWLSWLKKFNLLAVTVIVGLISFSLNLNGIKVDAVATFYAPQTRFWELLSGSVLAWFTLYKRNSLIDYKPRASDRFKGAFGKNIANISALIGSLFLALGFLRITKESSFPGAWAVLPVFGAIFIILAGPNAWINRKVLANKVAVWFGLISFPLYLWHWPLLSFARIVEGDTPSRNIRIATVVLAILFAWLTYQFVERPVRVRDNGKNKVTLLIILMFLMCCIGYYTYSIEGIKNRQINKQAISEIVRLADDEPKSHIDCLKKYSLAQENIRYCRLSGEVKPKIAIIGDSHGAALFKGLSQQLKNNFDEGLLLLGGRLFIDVAAYPQGNPSEIDVYKGGIKATKFVAEENSIETVIMVSRGPRYITPELYTKEKYNFYLLDDPSVLDKAKVFEIGLRRTLDLLLSKNKKLIFVLENPTLDFDPSSCQVKRIFSSASNVDCLMSKEKFIGAHKAYRDLVFAVLADFPMVTVFDPAKYLCDSNACYGRVGESILYGDQNHLSEAGSDFLAKFLIPYIETARQ